MSATSDIARSEGSSPGAAPPADRGTDGRSSRLWLALALALLCLPVLVDLWLADERRPFRYLAADAFLYLTVARNAVELGQFTLDQVHGTNGYHPLWQWSLAGLWGLADRLGAGETDILRLTLVANLLATAVGVFFLGRAASVARWPSPAYLILPLGAYALIVSALWWSLSPAELALENALEGPMPLYGTLWSQANGMESSLVIGFYGLAAWMWCKRPACAAGGSGAGSPARALGFGLALAALALARLDHGVFALALLAALGVRCWLEGDPRGGRTVAWGLLGFSLPLGLYCLGNLWLYGHAVPVSGRLKSTFPLPTTSSLGSLETLADQWRQGRGYLNAGWRQAQMLVPAACALLFPLWAVRARRAGGGLELGLRGSGSGMVAWLLASTPAVLVLALYNYFFVRLGAQGHWYYPLSTLYVSLVAFVALEDARPFRRLTRRRAGRVAWAALCLGLSVFYFLRFAVPAGYHETYARFYFEEAPLVRARFADRPPKLLEHDDGIVAFGTGFPSMQFSGFTGDQETVANKGQMFAFALARGHDHYTSLAYEDFGGLAPEASPEEVRSWMQRNVRKVAEQGRFEFSLAYRAADLNFALIRFERGAGPAGDDAGSIGEDAGSIGEDAGTQGGGGMR